MRNRNSSHCCRSTRKNKLFFSVCILAQVLGGVNCWHAFVDSEVVPTIPGTNLMTDLPLPTISSDNGLDVLDGCSILQTSIDKVNITCAKAHDINCARAWNSAIRDSRGEVDWLACGLC
eukprot:758265-Hanusia_phi.AAC.5